VFVVGCLGDWRSAAKVLFESESLCRDITPRRGEGKKTSTWPAQCASTLNASFGSKQGLENQHINSGAPLFVPTVYETHPADSRVKEMGDVCQTITTRWGTGGGNVPIALGFNVNARPDEMKFEEELSGTLTTCQRSGIAQAVDAYSGTIQGDVTTTITTKGGGTSSGPSVMNSMGVRRLTPMECERLQGFPDNYTNTPTSSDSTRYKALGNSMAVPVMKWIGNRIAFMTEICTKITK
jgi:DNA (cytosine-5)-methyltransferase 1